MDTIRRKNPRLQGEIGLAVAIAWFKDNGYSVSIPLCDNQPYDLVVEEYPSERLLKVQVKTTTSRKPATGHFQVKLRTTGGNQSFHTSKDFDNTASDLLFVLTDSREVYVVPTELIRSRCTIVLGPKWRQYKEAPDWRIRGRVVGEGFEPS